MRATLIVVLLLLLSPSFTGLADIILNVNLSADEKEALLETADRVKDLLKELAAHAHALMTTLAWAIPVSIGLVLMISRVFGMFWHHRDRQQIRSDIQQLSATPLEGTPREPE